MRTWKLALMAGCTLAAGCGGKPEPAPQSEGGARVAPLPAPVARKRPPGPLERRGSFAFDGVPLPEVIGELGRAHGLRVSVSPSIPVERWARHKVTLRMADVQVRAFFDWLVRPLGVEYAIEDTNSVWLTRGDELLLTEPLCARTYHVPTHFRARRPVRGALRFAREQRAIVQALHQCLRYVEDRREGCRLAFHGDQDVLVARLPEAGHLRLVAALDAMRHGSEPPGLPRPALHQLRAKLGVSIACKGGPQPVGRVLANVAEQAKVNLGWDGGRLGSPVVAIHKGPHSVREVLDAVVKQTKVRRYHLEPGRGIWLDLEGQREDLPESGATRWDRAMVRAYDVRPLLLHSSPQSVLKELRRQVDPGQWGSGLPAASVFAPTYRLIVVHDAAGQRRVASVVQAMLGEGLRAPKANTRD